jgi:hypothetical protein
LVERAHTIFPLNSGTGKYSLNYFYPTEIYRFLLPPSPPE